MRPFSEGELLYQLHKVVAMWKMSQDCLGKPKPLVGSSAVDVSGAGTYILTTLPDTPARLPGRSVQFPISVIEVLIRMEYLHPSDGPGAVSFLRPTTDALSLTATSVKSTDRAEFHRRYTRLRL